jgi:hypothetical protein
VAIGGVLTLTDTAVIYGDLVAPATVLKRNEGAQVYGQIITDTGPLDIEIPNIPDVPDMPDIPDIPEIPEFDFRSNPFIFFDQFSFALSSFTNVLWFIVRVFAFSAVAVLIAMFLPEHMQRTGNAVLSYPVLSGGLGILSVIVAIPIMVVLTIMILPIPFVVLLSILLCLGLFLGWIAFGLETGRRISESVKREWSLPIQAGMGTFALTFVVGIFGLILWSWVSGLLMIVICSIGLGAVLLTRFGVRDYIPADSSGEQHADPTVQIEEQVSEKKPDTQTKLKAKALPKRKASKKRESDK